MWSKYTYTCKCQFLMNEDQRRDMHEGYGEIGSSIPITCDNKNETRVGIPIWW